MPNQSIAVDFHGQTIPCLNVDGSPYVAMKPVCKNIGLNWNSQQKKIKRHAVLNSVAVVMTLTGSDSKNYKMLTLPLEFLNGWMFSVDASRVNSAIKDKLIDYQKECFHVLAGHFAQTTPALPNPKKTDAKPSELRLTAIAYSQAKNEITRSLLKQQLISLANSLGYSLDNVPGLNRGES